MAIKKISEFTEITALDDNDLFLIERNGEAKYSKAVSLKKIFWFRRTGCKYYFRE